MSLDKLNEKLTGFFNSLRTKKVEKKASLGNFNDVKNSEEMAKIAAMSKEMLDLPKYQPIINKLKSASGIVNFVTHNEYQPLVELLIKRAFPSSDNDLFALPAIGKSSNQLSLEGTSTKKNTSYYNQADLDQEYYLSPEFFTPGGERGEKATDAAGKKLEKLLMGSKVKITRKWLKEEAGMSPDKIEALLGREPTDQERQRQIDHQSLHPGEPPLRVGTLTPLGGAVLSYERSMKAIEDQYDSQIEQLDMEIFEHNMGDKKFPNEEDFQKKKRERSLWVLQKKEAVDALDIAMGNSIDASRIIGTVDRNNDGFVNYAPQNQVKTLALLLGRKVLSYIRGANTWKESEGSRTPEQEEVIKRQQAELEKDILTTSLNLKKQLEDTYTSNSKLNAIKTQWLSFLGNGSHKDFLRIVNSYNIMGIYTQLQTTYQEIYSQQGKVLIIDDFDRSVFCSKDQQGKVKMDDRAESVFLKFKGKNAGQVERDRSPVSSPSEKSQTYEAKGKRVILIKSSERISNLPASTVIELNISPVDKAEAEIIVRNTLKPYTTELQRSIKRKLYRDIAEKYTDLNSKEAQEETAKMRNYLEGQEDVGGISEETRLKMMTYIIGLGQEAAIESVEMAVISGIERTGDDIVRRESKFNEENILKTLEEDVGDRFQENVKGIFKMKREVEFENYAYEQESDWAKQVGTVKKNVEYFRFLRTVYETNKKRIRDLTKIISASESAKPGSNKKLDPNILKSYIEEKNGLELENRESQSKIEMEASDMLPHFYILHGDPGVGKTIWGSALASLLKYTLFKIDLSDQKNMWYGNTEENCTKLLNYLKSAQECVFIMDEVDKMLSSGDSPSAHQVDKAMVAKLLEFFGNKSNDEIFIKNKVYFIMTTNYIDDVSIALKARADVKEFVPKPKSVEAYSAILRSSIENLRPRFPKAPVDSINWNIVAKALSKKEVDFRHLDQTLEISFKADNTWQQTMEMFSSGMTDSLGDLQGLGMPLTIENMLEVCDIVSSGQSHGVMEVIGARTNKVKAMLEPYLKGQKKFETKPFVSPYTKKAKDVLQFPEDITKIMRGEGASKDVPPSQVAPDGWDYKKTIDPETGMATVDLKPKVNPAEEMKKLQDTGFEEKPLIEVDQERQKKTKEETPSKKKKEDVEQKPDVSKKQDQEEKIASSTDYYFGYLQKEGMVLDNQIVPPQKNTNKQPRGMVTAKEKPLASKTEDGSVDDLASRGIYYFGGLLIAPINNRAKPQQLRSFNREL